MIELQADIWLVGAGAGVIAITTNGAITSRNHGVMGRGVAEQAKSRYDGIEARLGWLLRRHGNHVQQLHEGPPILLSFPVKHHWQQPADLELIERSATELVALTNREGWTQVVLPRPGCGNGQRTWEEVKPRLMMLDHRFVVVHL